MMKTNQKATYTLLSILLLLCTIQSAGASNPKDVAGSKDHSFFSRYPETYISHYFETEYDEFMVATDRIGPLTNKEQLPPVERYEGKVTIIEYRANTNKPSALQIFRNYEEAFSKAGLETIFTCKNDGECGNKFIPQLYWYGNPKRTSRFRMFDAPNTQGKNSQYHYWSGKGTINDKHYYVSLVVASRFSLPVVAMLDINEVQTLVTDKIKIDLDALTQGIESKGKVVLGGILFDTNKTLLKSESLDVIELLSDYLNTKTNKNFYVVGHTDSDGTYQFNLNLSSGRAKAVVEALVERGVNRKRLVPVGVGPVSPEAKNNSEQNKASNRRVELVEQ